MPEPPPVTSVTFPCRSPAMICSPILVCRGPGWLYSCRLDRRARSSDRHWRDVNEVPIRTPEMHTQTSGHQSHSLTDRRARQFFQLLQDALQIRLQYPQHDAIRARLLQCLDLRLRAKLLFERKYREIEAR